MAPGPIPGRATSPRADERETAREEVGRIEPGNEVRGFAGGERSGCHPRKHH